MKRFAKLAALAAVAAALCFALIGCGGGDPAKNFTGTWKLSGMTSEGEVLAGDDMAMLEAMGMTASMTLAEDGTLEFELFGEVVTGTWSADSADACTLVLADLGGSVPAKLSGDTLTIEVEGDSMTFTRTGAAPASAGASGATEPSSGAADPEPSPAAPQSSVLIDDAVVTVEVLGTEVDWADDPGYKMVVTNHTDKVVNFYPEYGTFSVGGKMIEMWGSVTLQPGTYAEGFFYFDDEEVGGGVDKLVDVKGTFVAVDDDTWDELGSYKVQL